MVSKEYKSKLTQKQDYGHGATRDAAKGKGRFDLIPDLALTRVAKVYERGADNHGARNWEKGMPISRMLDSAIRHIYQHKMSKYMSDLSEEDHLAHAIWNLLGAMHNEEMIARSVLPKELDDLPRYLPTKKSEILVEVKKAERAALTPRDFGIDEDLKKDYSGDY